MKALPISRAVGAVVVGPALRWGPQETILVS